MEVIAFDVEGKFAHFRKYYANNTAMSFSMPPRTTIMGMLGAICGMARDSYYEAFRSDHLLIGAGLLQPVKKTFHRVNFLRVKTVDDLRGKEGRVQTPFEVVMPHDLARGMVQYRIYIAPNNGHTRPYEQVKAALQPENDEYRRNDAFNLALGTANFSASVVWKKLYPAGQVQQCPPTDQFVEFSSGVCSEKVVKLDFAKQEGQHFNSIEEELMPADFKSNHDREVVKMNRVLFTTDGLPLRIQHSGTFWELKDDDSSQFIDFLE